LRNKKNLQKIKRRKYSLKKVSRGLWAAWLVILILVAAGSFYVGRMTAPESRELESVTFLLDWAVGGKQCGLISALTQGYYADEGLAVTLLRGYGSTDTSKRVFAGEGEFGFVDTIAMINARATDIYLKQIGMVFHKSPVALLGLPGVGPTKPEEIVGKKIGLTSGSTDTIQFEMICSFYNINIETEVERAWLSSTAKVAAVLAGEVDAVSGYAAGEGVQIALGASIAWEDLTKMYYYDWGIDTYSNGLIATEDYIKNNPDICERFVRATMKGIAWAMKNPEEAVDLMVTMFPELDEDRTLEEWLVTIDTCLWNEETQENGIGYMIKEKMQKSIDLTVEVFGIVDVPVEDVFTNEFVENLPNDIKFPLA
jgi:NitT/TauT family transport system substrate-binding protein